MPELKFAGMEGAEEATISTIHVKVGQELKKGDQVFDIEADKASDTVTAPFAGKVSTINFQAGDQIKIGDVFLSTDESATQAKNEVELNKPDTVVAEKTEVNPPKPELQAEPINQNQSKQPPFLAQGPVLATPIARKAARELGVDLRTIKGTGPFGRVLQADIELAKTQGANIVSAEKNSTATKTYAPMSSPNIDVAKIEKFGKVVHLPISGIRKAVANQMSLSMYTAPHVTLFIDVDAENLVNFRTVLKTDVAKTENGAIKLTFMPFFVKAVAKVLAEERFQLINSTLDLANNEILVKKYFNIGMAADTDKGLVVPVIKDVNKLSLLETAQAVNELADKARKGSLKGEEMQGGTFTITNFGSAGLKSGTPIINYPEVAILGIGALEARPVISDEQIIFHQFFPLSLSIDHRVIDGAPAGYFLKRLKELLENPALILC